ncbi:anti-sigma factor [Streptomyces sp. BH-SS-21]|uniref:Regulator of SigK n=1 Tax=Streptomyces liliiviolaceus TaxID=2823109 RepID=A0A941BBU0_9ACTN|nr:anti-sigma factor [Streptomyces liliiviolaceus]MBQ0855326.1 anti-sigma factor [Streptomyces liliiviolaceus]
MSTVDLHTLTGAYALHALSDDERSEFERHAADCEACTQEALELSETAARLGLAVSAASPAALKSKVMRRITTVRQDSPRVVPLTRPPGGGVRARRLSRWALAACAAGVAAFGGTTVWQYDRAQDANEQARQSEQRTDAIASVLAASDARTSSAELADGARGTVVVSKSRDEAVFIASGMAAPPSGKVYQLWFNDDGTMRSAGLMDSHRTAEAVLLEGDVDNASGMGITVEPAGGSAEPTSDPVALMKFPA